MAKNKVKKKPTIKEMASAIIEINAKVNNNYALIKQLDTILGLYVEMKKDNDKLNEHIMKRREEMDKQNEQKENGKTDKPNLQGDTDGESSRTEGVRKAGK